MDKNAVAARKEYMKEWRAKNPEKVRAANVRYWESRAAKIMAKQQAKEAADGGKKDEN